MLHHKVQCVTANETISGLYDTVKYLMNDLIKEFVNECFIKIFLLEILFITTFMIKIVQLTMTVWEPAALEYAL